MVKNPLANAGDTTDSDLILVRKISWRRKWHPPLVFLPWKSHRQRSLVDYSPRIVHDWTHTHTCLEDFSSVQSLSHVQLLATPWTTAYQAPPSMGFSRQEYWSGLPLPSLIFQWVSSFYQVANILYLQLQHQSFQWIFRLISFRIDGLISLLSKVWSPTPQFQSINSLALSFLYGPTHPYMTMGKTIALTIWAFVGKVMALLFNMLSRFLITFLPRSKPLLISWLQSQSAVILEPPKIKSDTVSIVSPSICYEVMGLGAMIFIFWMLNFKPAFITSS